MATYYIDYNRGSDSNAGTSSSAPWQNLSKIAATTGATAGDAFLLADDSQWDLALADRVIPPTTWTGVFKNPVVIGKYSPSAQSTGRRPVIRWNRLTIASDWVYNAGLNGWVWTFGSAAINPAVLLRLGNTWAANAIEQTAGTAVASVDGRYNVGTGGTSLILWAPAGINPVDYYGSVLVSPQGQGAITLSSGRGHITVQDIAFEDCGNGVLCYSNNTSTASYIVERCSSRRSCLVAGVGETSGVLQMIVRDCDIGDFPSMGVNVNASAGVGIEYAEVSNNTIRNGGFSWSRGGVYVQARNAARTTMTVVRNNDIAGCRWGTGPGGPADGCGIYIEANSDGTQVYGNAIHDQFCAIQDNSGRRNFISGNLIYNVRVGLRVSNQDDSALSDCQVYNNTFIVGDSSYAPSQWGPFPGIDYPGIWMFWHGPANALNVLATNNIFANVGGARGLAFVGLAQNFASSSINVSGNIVYGFETNFLRALDDTVPVGGPSVTHAGTSDPLPYLNPDYSLKSIPAPNPISDLGTYIQGVKLRNGRARPGWMPVGAYQAIETRTTATARTTATTRATATSREDRNELA